MMDGATRRIAVLEAAIAKALCFLEAVENDTPADRLRYVFTAEQILNDALFERAAIPEQKD